jgi:hypothetical protein
MRMIDADYLITVLKADEIWGRYFGLAEKINETPTIEPNSPDGCEYCTGQKSICTVKCGKRTIAWLYTDDDVLVAEYQDGSIPEMRKKINYCPMCGAKMEVE